MEAGAIYYELGLYDGSLGLFMFIINALGVSVIDNCGSEEQKQRFIPELISFKKISCFGLTEPEYGSDATNMGTTARKVEGGYILNGKKRWPGNGDKADYSIIWAKNVSDKNKLQGFIVEKGTKGYTQKAIPNKAALRMVTK